MTAKSMPSPSHARHYAAVAQGFDRLAKGYDASFPRSLSLKLMRETVFHTLRRYAQPGHRWLELGCGTGRDAVTLAEHGVHVLATDISQAMLAKLRQRIRAHRLSNRVRPFLLGTGDLERLLPKWEGRMDGIAILFGALNYEPEPARVPPLLWRLLKPGGRIVAAVRNRICPWEIIYNLFYHPAPQLAFRRLRPDGAPTNIGGLTIRMRVYSPGKLARIFKPWFRQESLQGLSVALPPYMIARFHERMPRLERWLGRLEPLISRWPVFRSLGDHFLAVYTRVQNPAWE